MIALQSRGDAFTGGRFSRVAALLVVLGVASGCATRMDQAGDEAVGEAYRTAILDAAVIDAHEIAALPTVEGAEARMVTWTAWPQSYPVGQAVELGWGDVWVTLDGAVRQRCAGFERDSLVRDIQQLLGLPVKEETRRFVTLVVPTGALFRPCADPSLSTERCGPELPDDATAGHLAWYASQVAGSYRFPEGFPWTRLGYTYNWKPGASEFGPAEFVVRKGARVEVIAVDDTQSYCSG